MVINFLDLLLVLYLILSEIKLYMIMNSHEFRHILFDLGIELILDSEVRIDQKCVDLVGFKYPRFPSSLVVKEPAGVQNLEIFTGTPLRIDPAELT